MRLTIGGVIIILGIGAAAGFMVADRAYVDLAKNKIKGLKDQTGSLIGLFKFGEEKKPEVYSPPPPFPTGTIDSSTGPQPPTVATEMSTQTAALPLVAAPTPEQTAVVQVKPAKKISRKSKRARASKKQIPKRKTVAAKPKTPVVKKAAKVAPKPAPRKDAIQAMMGSYVSLELITGRSVQGVLESRTATHYVLNVPGLGPLEYPIENVKNVLPAQ